MVSSWELGHTSVLFLELVSLLLLVRSKKDWLPTSVGQCFAIPGHWRLFVLVIILYVVELCLFQTQARTNIPGPSGHTLRTYIAESAMTADARIQVGIGSYVLYICCYKPFSPLRLMFWTKLCSMIHEHSAGGSRLTGLIYYQVS